MCHTHLLAPVHTIFPELNTRAVVRGSLILIITAANLYKTDVKTFISLYIVGIDNLVVYGCG